MLDEKDLQNVPDHRLSERTTSSPDSCESISVTRVMMLMAVLAVIAGCGGKGVKRDRFVNDPVDSAPSGGVVGLNPRASLEDPFVGRLSGGSGDGPDPDSDPDSFDSVKVQKVFELCEKHKVVCQASLERFMKCGIGICGSCCINEQLVCKDGPVFNSQQLRKLTELGKFARLKSGKKVLIEEYYNWRQK